MLTLILTLAFLGLCLAAAVHDLLTLTIPNWLNLALAGLSAAALLAAQPTPDLAIAHVLTAGAAFVVCFGLFALNVFGGGDAKMIPAVMLGLGPQAAFPFLFWMALSGGLLAALLVLARRYPGAERVPAQLKKTFTHGEGVPYGISIATGVFVAFQSSSILGTT